MRGSGKCYNLSLKGELKVPHIYGLIRNLGYKFINRYKTSSTGQYPESDINCLSPDTSCISMTSIICIIISSLSMCAWNRMVPGCSTKKISNDLFFHFKISHNFPLQFFVFVFYVYICSRVRLGFLLFFLCEQGSGKKRNGILISPCHLTEKVISNV